MNPFAGELRGHAVGTHLKLENPKGLILEQDNK